MLRPTTPASMTIVMMYGSAAQNWFGQLASRSPSSPAGGRMLDRDAETLGAGEQQRREERADRRPAAEDDRREGDEAAPGGHAVLEGARRLEREVGARQAGQCAAEDDVPIAQPR